MSIATERRAQVSVTVGDQEISFETGKLAKQVICTVLSADMVTPHDILCINGASAALMLSPLPFLGPVGAVRIGRVEGELVINPTLQATEDDSDLDLIVVGTKDALTMI